MCKTAAKLGFKCVIHAVGPQIKEDKGESIDSKDKKKLCDTIYNFLIKANEVKQKAVVVSLVSSGYFGFPVKIAACYHMKAFLKFDGS